ncbi:hypothetical protein Sbs19_29480 [Sphingobium sp. BS19]|nr:hypothetical protein Sbs19_29480 [Sphingobium sp. BS19]
MPSTFEIAADKVTVGSAETVTAADVATVDPPGPVAVTSSTSDPADGVTVVPVPMDVPDKSQRRA